MADADPMQPRTAYCSFCHRSHDDAGPFAEGPGQVYICFRCVRLCDAIIRNELVRQGMPIPPVD